jgi:DNA-directed RNA polymerase III subunit RPC6
MFVPVSEDVAIKFADLPDEHRVVYKLIADSGSQGIWAKELSTKSKIPAGTLARLTKTLEHRRLIKQITPAQYKTRKVWMLYELEPASELSGGSWYKDGQIDSDLINILRDKTLEYLSNTGEPVTADDVQKFLASSHSLSRSIENIESILRTLVLDRDVIVSEPLTTVGVRTYRLRLRPTQSSQFTSKFFSQIPCISCHLRKHCAPGNPTVSPETCQYMSQWLQLQDANSLAL